MLSYVEAVLRGPQAAEGAGGTAATGRTRRPAGRDQFARADGAEADLAWCPRRVSGLGGLGVRPGRSRQPAARAVRPAGAATRRRRSAASIAGLRSAQVSGVARAVAQRTTSSGTSSRRCCGHGATRRTCGSRGRTVPLPVEVPVDATALAFARTAAGAHGRSRRRAAHGALAWRLAGGHAPWAIARAAACHRMRRRARGAIC